jgi:hypothetical protein
VVSWGRAWKIKMVLDGAEEMVEKMEPGSVDVVGGVKPMAMVMAETVAAISSKCGGTYLR